MIKEWDFVMLVRFGATSFLISCLCFPVLCRAAAISFFGIYFCSRDASGLIGIWLTSISKTGKFCWSLGEAGVFYMVSLSIVDGEVILFNLCKANLMLGELVVSLDSWGTWRFWIEGPWNWLSMNWNLFVYGFMLFSDLLDELSFSLYIFKVSVGFNES